MCDLLNPRDGQLQLFIEEVSILKSLNYDRNIVQVLGRSAAYMRLTLVC